MIFQSTFQVLIRSLAQELNYFLVSEKNFQIHRIVGEVTKNETFHYKSNKPEKNGLFCERIFGPIKSGFCGCGKYREIGAEKENPRFCQQCGVEFGNSRIRRYQMGYIKLACPVTHVWYLKRHPSSIVDLKLKNSLCPKSIYI